MYEHSRSVDPFAAYAAFAFARWNILLSYTFITHFIIIINKLHLHKVHFHPQIARCLRTKKCANIIMFVNIV